MLSNLVLAQCHNHAVLQSAGLLNLRWCKLVVSRVPRVLVFGPHSAGYSGPSLGLGYPVLIYCLCNSCLFCTGTVIHSCTAWPLPLRHCHAGLAHVHAVLCQPAASQSAGNTVYRQESSCCRVQTSYCIKHGTESNSEVWSLEVLWREWWQNKTTCRLCKSMLSFKRWQHIVNEKTPDLLSPIS